MPRGSRPNVEISVRDDGWIYRGSVRTEKWFRENVPNEPRRMWPGQFSRLVEIEALYRKVSKAYDAACRRVMGLAEEMLGANRPNVVVYTPKPRSLASADGSIVEAMYDRYEVYRYREDGRISHTLLRQDLPTPTDTPTTICHVFSEADRSCNRWLRRLSTVRWYLEHALQRRLEREPAAEGQVFRLRVGAGEYLYRCSRVRGSWRKYEKIAWSEDGFVDVFV